VLQNENNKNFFHSHSVALKTFSIPNAHRAEKRRREKKIEIYIPLFNVIWISPGGAGG
jgi:hypothetical protein